MVAGQASDIWHGIERWTDALANLHGRIAHRFAQAKGEVGLDQYEVRKWKGGIGTSR